MKRILITLGLIGIISSCTKKKETDCYNQLETIEVQYIKNGELYYKLYVVNELSYGRGLEYSQRFGLDNGVTCEDEYDDGVLFELVQTQPHITHLGGPQTLDSTSTDTIYTKITQYVRY